MCFLEVVDPFGFLGHVVAGGKNVRWSALSNKLRNNACLTSSLLSTSPRLGPPLLPICLPTPPPSHVPHACSFCSSACLWCGQLHLYLNQL